MSVISFICPSIYSLFHLFFFLSIPPSIYPSLIPSIHFQSFHLSLLPSIHQFIYPYIHLSISINLSVYLSILHTCSKNGIWKCQNPATRHFSGQENGRCQNTQSPAHHLNKIFNINNNRAVGCMYVCL